MARIHGAGSGGVIGNSDPTIPRSAAAIRRWVVHVFLLLPASGDTGQPVEW